MISRSGKEIIRLLGKLGFVGRRDHELFQDWVAASEAALSDMPELARKVAAGDRLQAADGKHGREVFARLRQHYDQRHHEQVFTTFAQCLSLLMQDAEEGAASGEYRDTIGNIYMEFAYPNPGTGQFFTPPSLAQFMAQMVVGDGERRIHEQIQATTEAAKEAGDGRYIALQAFTLASMASPDLTPGTRLRFVELLYACGYQPITMIDPCCGSGVMMLAHASVYPRWAIDYGLVQFYGVDIDPTCVAMARINFMLYGLNCFGLRCALDLSGAEIQAINPSPGYAAAVETAKAAAAEGDLETVRQIANETLASQLSLFDLTTLTEPA